jgi:mRNA interferase RelE/StbE
VTFEVDWEPSAVKLASRYLLDDPAGLWAVLEIVDALAESPRPDNAHPLGDSGLHRLRAGKYRVVYEVDETTRTVSGHARRTTQIAPATGLATKTSTDAPPSPRPGVVSLPVSGLGTP